MISGWPVVADPLYIALADLALVVSALFRMGWHVDLS